MKRKGDKPIFPATVVGGQPQGSRPGNKPITAIEALLAFASESDTSRKDFLKDPVDFARTIGLDLSAIDRAMLEKTDANNLERMVTAVGESGSVTRRFLLSAGVVAATAFLGSLVIIPNFISLGHQGNRIEVKCEIKSIKAATKIREKELEDRLVKKNGHFEYIGYNLTRRFQPGRPFELAIGFKSLYGAALMDSLMQNIKTDLTDDESRYLHEFVERYSGGMFDGFAFDEGETFTVTIVFTPQ